MWSAHLLLTRVSAAVASCYTSVGACALAVGAVAVSAVVLALLWVMYRRRQQTPASSRAMVSEMQTSSRPNALPTDNKAGVSNPSTVLR
jgi:NADH:ubiquinone oxidoreductase subunit K